jgi:hypothetical protein
MLPNKCGGSGDRPPQLPNRATDCDDWIPPSLFQYVLLLLLLQLLLLLLLLTIVFFAMGILLLE